MTKSLLIPAALLFVFFSCTKPKRNVKDYFPKVSTLSAEGDINGDITVRGEVYAADEANIAVGFCADTSAEPNMRKNPRQFNISSATLFSTIYKLSDANLSFKKYKPGNTYYFRAWAASERGYTYGESIAVHVPSNEAPCTIPRGQIDAGLGNGETIVTVSSTQSSGNFRIEFPLNDTENAYLIFAFTSKPFGWKYHSTNSLKPGDMLSVFFGGSNLISSESSLLTTEVYVKELSGTTIEITICNAAWKSAPDGKLHNLSLRCAVNY